MGRLKRHGDEKWYFWRLRTCVMCVGTPGIDVYTIASQNRFPPHMYVFPISIPTWNPAWLYGAWAPPPVALSLDRSSREDATMFLNTSWLDHIQVVLNRLQVLRVHVNQRARVCLPPGRRPRRLPRRCRCHCRDAAAPRPLRPGSWPRCAQKAIKASVRDIGEHRASGGGTGKRTGTQHTALEGPLGAPGSTGPREHRASGGSPCGACMRARRSHAHENSSTY